MNLALEASREFGEYNQEIMIEGVPCYGLRILPTVSSPPCITPNLPGNVILRIAQNAIEAGDRKIWAQTVFSCGLVSRCWSIAHQLLWENFGKHGHPIPDIISAARSLSRRPEMGQLVRRFSVQEIQQVMVPPPSNPMEINTHDHLGYMIAYNTILRLCPKLEELVLDYSTFRKEHRVLERLSNVQELQLYSIDGARGTLTLSETLDVMTGWDLRRLSISKWDRSTTQPMDARGWVRL
jgi:hypothetical protein